jgi:hypothetical protein
VTVIEIHQPRVPQTGLLYLLPVGFLQHLADRREAARASSSWPGLIVKYALTSETTPWLLPLPDFVLTWPVIL